MEKQLHIIVTGNPVEGFEFIGPFPTNEAACRYINTDPYLPDGDCWVAPLHSSAEPEVPARKRIFSYEDSKGGVENARWIAADNEKQANAEAKRRGWRPCGGEIFPNRHYSNVAELKKMGCDVVL